MTAVASIVQESARVSALPVTMAPISVPAIAEWSARLPPIPTTTPTPAVPVMEAVLIASARPKITARPVSPAWCCITLPVL